jgi:hypothetical protein
LPIELKYLKLAVESIERVWNLIRNSKNELMRGRGWI